MTTDRDGNRSNPYHPNPKACCEACVFGGEKHAEWCAKYQEVTIMTPPFAMRLPVLKRGYFNVDVTAELLAQDDRTYLGAGI